MPMPTTSGNSVQSLCLRQGGASAVSPTGRSQCTSVASHGLGFSMHTSAHEGHRPILYGWSLALSVCWIDRLDSPLRLWGDPCLTNPHKEGLHFFMLPREPIANVYHFVSHLGGKQRHLSTWATSFSFVAVVIKLAFGPWLLFRCLVKTLSVWAWSPILNQGL